MTTNTINKESGLYIDRFGEFVTEREYIKEWSEEIIKHSDPDYLYEKYGFDYDLDDDEVYDEYLWHFDEDVNRNSKDGLTIQLNNNDLQTSKVTLPRSDVEINFEDLDFKRTGEILDSLGIDYHSEDLELEIDDMNIFDGEYYLSYIANGKTVLKTNVTDTNFTIEEFVDYQVESFENDVSREDIYKVLDLPVPQQLSSDCGLKIGKMELTNTCLTTEISLRDKRVFTVKTDIRDESVFDIEPKNISAFEDAVDNAYFTNEKFDKEEVIKSSIASVIKEKYSATKKELLEQSLDNKDNNLAVDSKTPKNVKTNGLRM